MKLPRVFKKLLLTVLCLNLRPQTAGEGALPDFGKPAAGRPPRAPVYPCSDPTCWCHFDSDRVPDAWGVPDVTQDDIDAIL